ncbi:hypothetical protein CEXT_246731 [Caerostris extrusa]|uniref:Uncharacterized protein n=1 Tax=Caerostris extrusa TaxID=172846 RepID=A0AAV4QG55_CAEEX|nr:hypothetical protein CEXT_246731 [Caerostris extrusa]
MGMNGLLKIKVPISLSCYHKSYANRTDFRKLASNIAACSSELTDECDDYSASSIQRVVSRYKAQQLRRRATLLLVP